MSTKEIVFDSLKNNLGNSVSGEELADLCKVSRAAIWKAINSLRQEGFKIDGTPKGGYVLSLDSQTFSKNLFDSYYEKSFPDSEKIDSLFFLEIDSTNNQAKKMLMDESKQNHLHGTILVAESQTKGRGRMDRNFISPSGSGLYISIIYSPKKMELQPVWISVYTAVAICRVLKKIYKIDAKIKWVNDIYLDGKKICGILTEGFANFESGQIESAVIGFGLNIYENADLINSVKDNPVGAIFKNQNQNHFNRSELAAELCGTVLKIFKEPNEKVIDEYKSLSFLIGHNVEVRDLVKNINYEAEVVDINSQAHLVVKNCDGKIEELFSGEVSLKIPPQK